MGLASLTSAVRRALRPRYFRRALESAAGGDRWQGTPGALDPAGMIHVGAAATSARAAQLSENTPHVKRGLDALVGSLVGAGFKARSQHDDEGVRELLIRRWTSWTNVADADGLSSFSGLMSLGARDMVLLGEALFIWVSDPETTEPTLRRLHPEQLDRSRNSWSEGHARICQGVEFDVHGRRAAYWIKPSVPGENSTLTAHAAVRVPRSEVLHIFRPLFPGQHRGLSWLAPVLLAAHELHGYYDASLERQRMAAARLGVVQMDPTALDDLGAYDMDLTNEFLTAAKKRIPQASFVQLVPGESMTFSDVPDAGNIEEFATAMLRMIAAGIGVTFEQVSGDYSKVNYSSARAATLEFRRFVRSVQEHVLVHQFCRPAWQGFIRHQILTGRISASAYQADPSAYDVRWLPPHWPSVDPVKDAHAAVMELQAGLRSRSALVAERGEDIEELDRQIAADQARAQELGLTLVAGASPVVTEDAA